MADVEPTRSGGLPTRQRELRAQGRRTMQRLLDAGLDVFADRGYHATRVDDVVRVAATSHGTFYLYFSNKEDLLQALAIECMQQLEDVCARIGPVDPGPEGSAELRRFLDEFLAVYRRFGPVIRAWRDGQDGGGELHEFGVQSAVKFGQALATRLREAGAVEHDAVAVVALLGMIERYGDANSTHQLVGDPDEMLDTLARIAHRGLFGAGPVA